MLKGIQNFLQIVDTNWTTILVIVGLCLGLYKKAKNYLDKSNEEKIAIAKLQVHQAMMKMISDAEIEWQNMSQSGSIKRSQVIQKIFEKYPILSKAIDQESLINWIDTEINNALKTLREIVKENEGANQFE